MKNEPKPQPAIEVPPADTNGEMHLAGVLIKRFRNQMKTLPRGWRMWIAKSLVAGVDAEQEEETATAN